MVRADLRPLGSTPPRSLSLSFARRLISSPRIATSERRVIIPGKVAERAIFRVFVVHTRAIDDDETACCFAVKDASCASSERPPRTSR